MEEKIACALNEDEAVKIILKYDSRGNGEKGKPMIFKGDRLEIDTYFAAVDLIVELMGPTNSSDTETRLKGIMQTARDHLKDEFERISSKEVRMLSTYINHDRHSTSYTSSISSSSFLAEYVPDHRQSEDDLLLIAERMRSMRYLPEFVELYKIARKSLLLAFLRGVDIKKLSAVDIQKMEWETLEKKIKSWIKTSLKFLNNFQKEREMFQTIFEDLGAESNEAHLVEMLEDPAGIFFGFAEAVSTSRHSPERLFRILDLLRNIVLILPMVEDACGEKSLESIRILPGKIASQLGVAAKGMLSKFDTSVQSDLSYITNVKEAIHPLTRYVMCYMIRMITEYKDLLLELVFPDPPTMQNRAADGSRLASGLVLTLRALKCNLKSKCKEEDAFGHLFMMNNVDYMVESIINFPELKAMVGRDFFGYLKEMVRSESDAYMSSTWNEIEQLLSKGLAIKKSSFHQKLIRMCTIGSTGRVASSREGTLRFFNDMFDEIHRTHSTWLVPDTALRYQLRETVRVKVIPMYQSILEEFSKNSTNQKKLARCIKYSVDDLNIAISQLFKGRRVASLQSNQTQRSKNWKASIF